MREALHTEADLAGVIAILRKAVEHFLLGELAIGIGIRLAESSLQLRILLGSFLLLSGLGRFLPGLRQRLPLYYAARARSVSERLSCMACQPQPASTRHWLCARPDAAALVNVEFGKFVTDHLCVLLQLCLLQTPHAAHSLRHRLLELLSR
jgi:hypothetical protein